MNALIAATDEVVTNHGSESGRWLRLCADIESREDFGHTDAKPRVLEVRPVWHIGTAFAESCRLADLSAEAVRHGRAPDAFGVYACDDGVLTFVDECRSLVEAHRLAGCPL